MYLSGEEIIKRLTDDLNKFGQDEFDKKLVITPILNKLEQIKVDAASVDLRLGTHFSMFNRFFTSHTDPASEDYQVRTSIIKKEILIGDKLILHPHQFVLGETLEWVKMPNDLVGILTAKSSDAREGLQIESANLIHPRFSGPITLELKNNGEIPITLYPGLYIGQLSLIKLSEPIKKLTPISKSTFGFSLSPTVSTHPKNDLEIIKKFKEIF